MYTDVPKVAPDATGNTSKAQAQNLTNEKGSSWTPSSIVLRFPWIAGQVSIATRQEEKGRSGTMRPITLFRL